MKSLLLLTALTISAQQVTDLGYWAPNTALRIEPQSPNFKYHHIEFMPVKDTNKIVGLIKTSDLLFLDELNFLPDGKYIMGIKSIHSNVKETSMELYSLTLDRTNPTPPVVSFVFIPHNLEETNRLTNIINNIQRNKIIPLIPLPKATNISFGTNYIDPKKRRNE
jgi:hypothetical protein